MRIGTYSLDHGRLGLESAEEGDGAVRSNSLDALASLDSLVGLVRQQCLKEYRGLGDVVGVVCSDEDMVGEDGSDDARVRGDLLRDGTVA